MKIDEYQRQAHKTAKSRDIEVFTLGLFGEAGSVASSIKKLKRENTAAKVVKDEIATELGDVLWYVAEIATHYDIQLSEIAEKNLEKSRYLFNGNDEQLDAKAPKDQRFPEKFSLTFEPSGAKVHIRVNGVPFGDELDDNAHNDDGYRFHDVFHFAYMTRLGWSPVARQQLGLKRKYNTDIDRIEDGARSVFLEEGISVFVFNQNTCTAEGVSAFSDRRNIPFSVLSAIKVMTKGLEVRNRDITAWRDAIAMGFQNFDKLMSNNGGRVSCDMVTKKMKFDAR
ncbi:nucleoside triphosphate pyrophosphohydrolase family protein [Aquisediminimonas profunda]|uniref:nucleoside triphosphate pyrophosphohydrolase family protein n=1 Tax=Aquisediminimonas profunda TaxID=1550733 RepID=UPI001C63A452|nr:nucleoside triphosphate pyrophosphohydrolase family protein [Aquisediminimonas profunda]